MKLDTPAIVNLIKSYEKQTRAIKDELLRYCWYMRGGLTFNEAMMLSNDERTMIANIIKDNLETAKKSGMPFF